METDLMTRVAAAVVEKLTTEAWQGVLAAIGGLWRMVHPERGDTVEAEVVDTRAAVLAAREAGDDGTVAGLVAEWGDRLRRLAAKDPDVEVQLRRLLAAWTREPSAERTVIGPVRMSAKASGHSRVTMAGRDVHITGS
ncbi:hypothetical protein JOF41_003605 [Saccharothrix coeruleofusca]|uniref:hypothetical protein n=1 Tax=Saccharothrix coeruleofusca TaxID=33919 RepID=UPI001AEA8D07|nr:hypothetical protein [Saccharothrix coeruleofusca]MBP2337427.1 hypothetical protein [Saccharothrix coeruleofusca]